MGVAGIAPEVGDLSRCPAVRRPTDQRLIERDIRPAQRLDQLLGGSGGGPQVEFPLFPVVFEDRPPVRVGELDRVPDDR